MLYGNHNTYNETLVVKQDQSIRKSYEYFRELLDDNGFAAKGLVINQGGTYTGQDIECGWADILQSEKMEATFLVKRMVYKIAKGMEQNQTVQLIETFCVNDTIHSVFALMGLEYNGSPVTGGSPSCLDTDPIPNEYDCDGQLPCPDPGFGIKKLSYWTYTSLIERLRGSSWQDIQTIYEQYNVYVYKFIKQGQPVYLAWWDWWNETRETKQVALTLADITSDQAKITEAIPDTETGQSLNPNDYPNFFNSYMVDLTSDLTFPENIAVIRERQAGKQRLEIYNPPADVGGDTGSPGASDLSFGNANNKNIAMAGVDIDGNGVDEIAVIRQRKGRRQRLEIYSAPAVVDGGTGPPVVEGETGLPIASDLSFGSANSNKNNIAMAGVDIDGNGVDEIAVVRQKTGGKQRLEIYNAPAGVEGDTGPPIASDLTFGSANSNKNNIAIAGIQLTVFIR